MNLLDVAEAHKAKSVEVCEDLNVILVDLHTVRTWTLPDSVGSKRAESVTARVKAAIKSVEAAIAELE